MMENLKELKTAYIYKIDEAKMQLLNGGDDSYANDRTKKDIWGLATQSVINFFANGSLRYGSSNRIFTMGGGGL